MKQFIALSSLFLSVSVSAASLSLDPGVQLVSINGEAVSSQTNYLDIENGRHVLSVRYHAFHEYGAEDHAVVRSDVHVLQFSAMNDTDYQITLPDLDSEQAYQFAQKPVFALTDQNGKPIHNKQWGRDQLLAELLLSE